MSYRLRLSRQALDDLASIGEYILETSNSQQISNRFIEELIGRCEKLASLPGTLGRDRSDLKPGFRSAIFRSYVIFFRYADRVLEIVSILEGHRDIVTYFRDDEI